MATEYATEAGSRWPRLVHVSGDAQDFPDARQGRWLRSEGAADQAGHDIGVSVDVYTQSTLNAKLELVNRLEQSLLESF